MVQTFKCPSCGGELVYEGGEQELTCPHCLVSVSVEEIEKNLEKGQNYGPSEEGRDTDGDGILEYSCPSCGANLVTNANTAASVCSFCGTPLILSERISGTFRPSRMIPFAFDKEKAKAFFKEWRGRGLFTPGDFKSDAVMNRISGVYVPYWLYSYRTDITVHGTAERVHRMRKGDMEEISTEHFLINREMTAEYEEVPYDASEKMPDGEMECLEPYDYTKMVPFQVPYLSGFAAEKYDYTDRDLKEKVQQLIRSSLISKAVSEILGYTAVHPTDTHVTFSQEKTEYVMMPVWTLNYSYRGKKYPLFMNGSTGKINGNLPISPWKVAILFGILTVGIFLLCLLAEGGI